MATGRISWNDPAGSCGGTPHGIELTPNGHDALRRRLDLGATVGRGYRSESCAERRGPPAAAPARYAERRSKSPLPRSPRPARRHHRALAPRLRPFATSGGLRDRGRSGPPLPGRPRSLALREGDARGPVLRRVAGRGDRGEVRPSPRSARPRRCLRHQSQRSRDTRHPGRLQHLAQGGATTELARSRDVGAGLGRGVGRRADRPRAQLGCVVPLRLASIYVQPTAHALAAQDPDPDARRVGRERRDRDAILRTGLQRVDPGLALRADRGGGAPPGARAARGLRRPRRGLPGRIAVDAWYQCENPYPFVPQEILDRADSVRASLPSKYCDPKIAADLFEEVLDEFMLCDDQGLNVVAIEHHAGINSLFGANPLILGILARQTRNVRILSMGTLVSLRQD